ncbi:MAG: MarR family transcriptional regulator [Pseudomonadota bacterium]
MHENYAELFAGEHTVDYLNVWKRALIAAVHSDKPDLTSRQMALMLIVYLENGAHTVRGLAARLKVAKPVITRALNALSAYGYVRRKTDEADRRNLFVQRTVKGAVFLSEFADFIAGSAQRHEANELAPAPQPQGAIALGL